LTYPPNIEKNWRFAENKQDKLFYETD
jgi:hypothetical protein